MHAVQYIVHIPYIFIYNTNHAYNHNYLGSGWIDEERAKGTETKVEKHVSELLRNKSQC